MRPLFLLFIFFIFPTNSWCQMSPKIQSGRPGQTIGSGVVGTGVFQVQSGFDRSGLISESNQSTISNNVVRLGLAENFEMSALLNYSWIQNDQPTGSNSSNGLSDLHIGFRNRVIEKAHGLIPSLAIQTRFKLTTVDSEFRNSEVSPIFTISLTHALNTFMSLTNNFVLSYNGEDSKPNSLFASNLGWSMGAKWGAFFELYMRTVQGESDLLSDAGFEYFVNNDLKIDLSAGYGRNEGTEEAFISAGVSWRTSIF